MQRITWAAVVRIQKVPGSILTITNEKHEVTSIMTTNHLKTGIE